jgi:hypothetical protein
MDEIRRYELLGGVFSLNSILWGVEPKHITGRYGKSLNVYEDKLLWYSRRGLVGSIDL